MRSLGALGLALAATVPTSPGAAKEACQRYAALSRLPLSFVEISSGDLGRVESFVYTDRKCTCDNLPAVARALGGPARAGVNWDCRPATANERRSH